MAWLAAVHARCLDVAPARATRAGQREGVRFKTLAYKRSMILVAALTMAPCRMHCAKCIGFGALRGC